MPAFFPLDSSSEPKIVNHAKIVGVGRCIYCSSDGGEQGLRDEHIVPEALGGTAALLNASCRNCESKTSYIDGYLARSMYQQLRVLLGLKGKRNSLSKITTLPMTVMVDGQWKHLTPAIKDAPAHALVPMLAPPSLLTGSPPSDKYPYVGVIPVGIFPDAFYELAGLKRGEEAIFKPENNRINLPTLGRAIAKIAYCSAVQNFGLDRVGPLDVPNLILGDYAFGSHYVGGFGNLLANRASNLHEIALGTADVRSLGKKVVFAQIRLFANMPSPGPNRFGPPTFLAVAGEMLSAPN